MNLEFVSAVPSDWLEQEFLPSLQSKIIDERQPIVWLVTESSTEANYLLEKVRSWTADANQLFSSVTVEIDDPFLLWEDLVGTASEEGLILRTSGVIAVWNGCFIPLDLLTGRVHHFRRICKATNASLLLPVFHESLPSLQGYLGEDGIIAVPRFGSFSEARRTELLEYIIDLRIPNLTAQEIKWLAKEIVQALPGSRAEAEAWISHYAEQGDTSKAISNPPPPPLVERFPCLPPTCPTRDQLASAFSAAQLKLEQASNLSQVYIGKVLIRKIEQNIIEPFRFDNCLWWFVALISNLSCQLFDGMDPTFDFLAGFKLEDNHVVSAPSDSFYKNLRYLRTSMQHGLITEDDRNVHTLKQVRSWFQSNCGKLSPGRGDWRRLSTALVMEWDRAVTRLRDVLFHIKNDTALPSIMAQLRQHEKNQSKDEWRTHLKNAVAQINPDLDIEATLERYLPFLQRELKRSLSIPDRFSAVAQALAQNVVVQETSRCPVQARDLIVLGIQPGPLLGRALKQAETIWEQNPGVTKEELVKQIEKWAPLT